MNWLCQAQNQEYYHVYNSEDKQFLAALKIGNLNKGLQGTEHPRSHDTLVSPFLPFTLMLGGDKHFTNKRKQTND